MRLSRVQRIVVFLMMAAVAVTIGVGFWPVAASVNGDPSYSCGSGFIHSGHRWKVDSRTITNERAGDAEDIGTPLTVCPGKIYDHRDIALLVAGFGLVIGVLVLALTQRQQDRGSRAVLASMRLRNDRRR